MPSQPRPQSQWLRSFILYSLLACASLAAVGFLGAFVFRHVSRRFESPVSGAGTPADVRPNVPLPSVTFGWDDIATNLLSAFDYVDVIALGETHDRKLDSELRLRLVRDPDFPFRVHFIVMECGNSLYQGTLDRYTNGDDVPMAAVEKVWRDTTQIAACDSPVYAEFYAAVREVNQKLPPDRRLRVIAGDPPIDWDRIHSKEDFDPYLTRRDFPVSLSRVAIPRGEKALVIYGNAHVKRPGFPLEAAAPEAELEDPADAPSLPAAAPTMFKALQVAGPGRVLVIETIAGLNPFQTTIQFGELPALVPLTGMHSTVGTGLNDEADACIYFGDSAAARASVGADPAIYRDTPYGAEVARRQKAVAP